MIKISLGDGKYEILHNDDPENYKLEALRYGEKWRDLVGDNLISYMLIELEEELKKNENNSI